MASVASLRSLGSLSDCVPVGEHHQLWAQFYGTIRTRGPLSPVAGGNSSSNFSRMPYMPSPMMAANVKWQFLQTSRTQEPVQYVTQASW